MSYLRHVCADKGHVCPSTAVEGTDAIRLYTCPCSNRTRLRGDRAAFYFTSNDSSKQALCPRTTRPYLARRFYRNVFCLSFVALDGTARTTDRWQLSVSRREKEEPIVVMIFFSSHLLFPTFEDRERIPILYIYIYIYSASGLFASCIGAEKNKRPLSLSSFAFFLALSSKFSWKKRGNDATNSFYHVRNSLTYEFLDLL